MFTACGKLPAEPDLAQLMELVESKEFSGNADDYLDSNGSSLLMYCIGPANAHSEAMVDFLLENGASATHRNTNGQSAMGYINAWKKSKPNEYYGPLVEKLRALGCNPHETPAF